MGFNLRTGLTTKSKREHNNDMNKLTNHADSTGKSIDLNYKVVCITGTIPGMSRKKAMAELQKKFPKIGFVDHINSSADYLITGFGIGQTKLKKAKEYGISIIESAKFFS